MFWIQSITKRRISSQSHFHRHTRSRRAPPPPPRCGCLAAAVRYPVRRPMLLTIVATADALFVSKCVAIFNIGVSLPSGNRFFQHSSTTHNKPDHPLPLILIYRERVAAYRYFLLFTHASNRLLQYNVRPFHRARVQVFFPDA